MSASKYPTYSLLAPLLYKLLEITLKSNPDNSSTLKNIKSAIASDLQERYGSIRVKRSLLKAAFLDPRFKDMDSYVKIENRCDVIEDVKMELIMKFVGEEIVQDDQENEAMKSSENQSHDESDEPTDSTEPPLKKKCTALSHLLSDIYPPNQQHASQNVTTMEAIESELAFYKGEVCLDIDGDPLQWWKVRATQYRLLSQLARKYISVPATSVKSEEIFSTAGNILTQKRNRLFSLKCSFFNIFHFFKI